jgi:hypothetical protein
MISMPLIEEIYSNLLLVGFWIIGKCSTLEVLKKKTKKKGIEVDEEEEKRRVCFPR